MPGFVPGIFFGLYRPSVSSPAVRQGRERDPWRCAWEWIPFPSASLRPGMTVKAFNGATGTPFLRFA
jgi:hypothetical protein